MEKVNDGVEMSEEFTMSLQKMITEMYEDPTVKGAKEILDTVAQHVKDTYPENEKSLWVACYLVGYFIGSMHTANSTLKILYDMGALVVPYSGEDLMYR